MAIAYDLKKNTTSLNQFIIIARQWLRFMSFFVILGLFPLSIGVQKRKLT